MLKNFSSLPKNFVYLDQVDPTIMQDMMYYNSRNFIGQKINGYNSPRAIMTKETALALRDIQQEIKQDNYSLVVYDAYRPVKAVQHFVDWSKDINDQKMKEHYYPHLNKAEIFELGYVAARSSHSRGSTVDLTIIELGKTVNANQNSTLRVLKDGRLIPYCDDNTVDMYSSVDLMDRVSSHDSELIEEQYLQNRNYLRNKMRKYGFQEYSVEWWHYTLLNEPYHDQYFDFDVK